MNRTEEQKHLKGLKKYDPLLKYDHHSEEIIENLKQKIKKESFSGDQCASSGRPNSTV